MFFNLFKSKNPTPRSGGKRAKHAQDKKNKVEKIPVDQLRIGMYVRELDIPWEESSFMFQGMDIKTQQDVLDVQRQCASVWVDYTEYRLTDSRPADKAGSAFASKISLIDLEEKYDDAKDVHTKTKQIVTRLFDNVAVGGDVNVAQVKESVSSSVGSILRNPDASIWLTRLSEKDNAIVQSSLNVSALSIIAGRAMDMTKRELESLGVCALMHNIGKTKLPNELIQKAEPLSKAERVVLQTHTQIGYDILSASKTLDPKAAKVALLHHERVDGAGYPQALKGDKIPLFAKIVAIADAYNEMTTESPGYTPKSSSEALDSLYAERGKQFDSELVLKFIDGIGIFPPGSLVEMTNGEVGLVLSSTKQKLKPMVILILNKAKEAAIQQVIDLSGMCVDLAGAPYQIKTTLPDGTFGLVADDFQRAGLRFG
jgi:HD-GYP domain-containing protein (c-di-GMP phosphodiesterase class II)